MLGKAVRKVDELRRPGGVDVLEPVAAIRQHLLAQLGAQRGVVGHLRGQQQVGRGAVQAVLVTGDQGPELAADRVRQLTVQGLLFGQLVRVGYGQGPVGEVRRGDGHRVRGDVHRSPGRQPGRYGGHVREDGQVARGLGGPGKGRRVVTERQRPLPGKRLGGDVHRLGKHLQARGHRARGQRGQAGEPRGPGLAGHLNLDLMPVPDVNGVYGPGMRAAANDHKRQYHADC